MMLRRAFVVAILAFAIAARIASAESSSVILVLGDSISAGYGLPAGSGWVSLLQERLKQEHRPHTVVNASVSGDTTAGGRARLEALLTRYRPAITVIELGGNDGLRGGSVDAMRQNLDAMTAAAQKAGSRVLLIGMRMPPNYGQAYVERFDATFAEVAKAHKTALVPFLFEGFGENEAMFQPDRIHPVVAAQSKLLDNVWRELKPMLDSTGRSG
ncbi:MAG TPA: arylesterase [Casimicrobiaceae bacterium]|nr:arylesterase [Casimicrobiaceae bacterium]